MIGFDPSGTGRWKALASASMKRVQHAVMIGLGGALLAMEPISAAEHLRFTDGPFERSVVVESLQRFAREGEIGRDLHPYLGKVDADRRRKLQEVLLKRFDLPADLISRFLYTKMGEDVMRQLGETITLPSGANGRLALRSAVPIQGGIRRQFAPHPLTPAADEVTSKPETGCDVDPSRRHPTR